MENQQTQKNQLFSLEVHKLYRMSGQNTYVVDMGIQKLMCARRERALTLTRMFSDAKQTLNRYGFDDGGRR